MTNTGDKWVAEHAALEGQDAIMGQGKKRAVTKVISGKVLGGGQQVAQVFMGQWL